MAAAHDARPSTSAGRATEDPSLAFRTARVRIGDMDPIDATQLINDASNGDESAANRVLTLLYGELRRIAEHAMRGERDDHTLQPTALVHEAYMRVMQSADQPEWEGREHFVRFAARAMRNVLVDHARARGAAKRGSGQKPAPLDTVLEFFERQELDMLELNDALEKLLEADEELARLIELRFFAGLTIEETAGVMGVSTPTIERRWRVARMWLQNELQ